MSAIPAATQPPEPSGPQASVDQIQELHRLVEAADVKVVFQPIVDVRRREIHAYEVLGRPVSGHFANVVELLRTSIQVGRVAELGRLHREAAVRGCADAPLFINVVANEFDFGWLVRPDDPIFRHRHRVCLEVTESVPLQYFSQCHSVLAEIRKKGISVAVDDLGAGFSNLKYISDLEPDYVKLDRELIKGIRQRTRQFVLLRSIVDLCRQMEAKVVAEGVETVLELLAVLEAGVDYVQGYLLARPAPEPPEITWPEALQDR